MGRRGQRGWRRERAWVAAGAGVDTAVKRGAATGASFLDEEGFLLDEYESDDREGSFSLR